MTGETRPSFAGTWTLVPDKSTAPPSQHDQEISITQDAGTLTLARHNTVDWILLGRPNEGPRPETLDLHASATFDFDGAEHPDAAHGPSADSTYRAIWTRDQLVIITRTTRTRTPTNALANSVTSVERKALSLDAEGQLIVDTITISNPVAGGPTQAPPRPARSVYRKASFGLSVRSDHLSGVTDLGCQSPKSRAAS